MFELMSRHFWIVAIVVNAINLAIFKSRAARHIQMNPELAEGYAALFRGQLIWPNIPWLVMGVGCTLGGVPTVWHYLHPQDGNPYVLAWFASFLSLWILATFWLFFRGGAELLAQHPGLLNMEFKRASTIKLIWVLSMAGGIAAVIMMFTVDMRVPPP